MIGETREEKLVKKNSIIIKINGNEQMSRAPEISKFCRSYDYGMIPRLRLIFSHAY